MATNWYWLEREQEKGPVSFRELALMVREHVLNEDDLVRPNYSQEWQSADHVIGLFYMAQRIAIPRLEEPPAESVTNSGISTTESRGTQSLGGMNLLAEVAHMSVTRGLERTENDEALVADEEELQPPADFNSSGTGDECVPVADGEIAIAIGVAADEWDRRHASLEQVEKPLRGWSLTMAPVIAPLYRCVLAFGAAVSALIDVCFGIGKMAGLGAICRGLDRIASRQTLVWCFRIGCSAVFAGTTAWAVTSWSHYNTFTYPNPEWIAAGKTVFPLFGPCRPVEYNFLLFDLMLVSAAVGYVGASLLEVLAED